MCVVVFRYDLHECLPQGKEKLLLEDPLSQKEVVYGRVHSHRIA